MKTRHLAAVLAAICLALPASAQTLPAGVLSGPLSPQPGSGSLFPGNGSLFPNSAMPAPHGNVGGGSHHGHDHGFDGGLLIFPETEVVHDVLVVHDSAPEPPPPPSPPPPRREPWVMGRTYASLPGACMKMVERGASYFLCSGDWYLRLGSARYKAVASPL